MGFSERIKTVAPSATLAITSKAKAMRAQGEDVIILAAGEPDFDTPDTVKEAAIKAINDGLTKYTPASGTKSLKETICRKLKEDNGLDYEVSQIVVSNGAKHSIYNALLAICNPKDEVLIISPYWLSYPEMAKLAEAVPVIIKTSVENGFRATPEDIKNAITDKTKAIIINSPSNPAGVVYSIDELKAIAEVCVSAGLTIISDEIYEKLIYDGVKHVSIASVSPEVKKATVVINGVSKSHSMTGWRIGYMAAEKEIIDLVSTLQSQSTSNPSSISQAAAECALTADLEEELAGNTAEFEKRRDAFIKLFEGEEKIKPFKPTGAFYLFCDISASGLDSLTFAKRLLDEKKVAVIPGGPFGEDGFIRLSFATDMKTIETGVERIIDWINSI